MNICKAPTLRKEESGCSPIVQWPDQHLHTYTLGQDLELNAFSPCNLPIYLLAVCICFYLMLHFFLSLLQPAALWGLHSNTLFM
jgi:hypothetical protein